MSKVFDLHVSTDEAALAADLRLYDGAGDQLAWRQVRLGDHPASRWEGLFDLRRYVRRYAGNLHPLGEGTPLDEAGLLRELGVFLGQEVLGGADPDPTRNLFARIAKGIEPRTLRVRLPAGDQATAHLAAAFARVPWDIACAGPDEDTLAEKNVLIRALAGGEEPTSEPLALAEGEPLRVLLVFAEAPGSSPLAARLERQRLLELFYGRIYPRRRVEVDVLCHGVTRERLVAQIGGQHGYHLVHWSGHGHLNLLELYPEGEEPSRLSGQELVDLLKQAGGYVPRLVFLGACHSGGFLELKDWAAFEAVVEGREPAGRVAVAEVVVEPTPSYLEERPGFTGTAHALLDAGVPTVVAMRYEVGDDYARDLAAGFYRHLLADERPKRPDEALNQARQALRQAERKGQAHGYSACDHATPVFFGAADAGFAPPPGETALPALHPPLGIREVQPHRDFVGRSAELARLGSRWLGAGGQRPVAVARGLGGLGKTALAAEAVGLWHQGFRWVFAFQAKPVALALDELLRQLHVTWEEQQKEYAKKVAQYPAEAIWRPAVGEFTGERRHNALRGNLVRALKAEPVLLVLDNFETCLRPDSAPGVAGHACQDPQWDALLAELAEGLVGTGSRVLLTSRWPVAALAGQPPVEDVLLGPLPPGEVAVYVRSHPVLRRLQFEGGESGPRQVRRLVEVSRGHPLLLDRLARLAERDPVALDEALAKLEQQGLGKLADFFAADPKDAAERKYLEDALAGSIDLLLERPGPEARRALWVLALANEPVIAGLWRGVWEGRDFEEEQARELRALLDKVEALPAEMRPELPELPDEIRARLAALAAQDGESFPGPEFEPLRRSLVGIGLVTEEREGEADENPEYTCHELVRERILAWMAAHPAETGARTREQVWAAYGDRLVAAYQRLVESNQLAGALEAGSRALRYVVRAGAFDKLGAFASRLVTSTSDPRALQTLLPELERAAAAASPGELRWRARLYLADALRLGGQPDASLPHYAAAAAEAEAAEAWGDLSVITGNWANALGACGQLSPCQQKQRESARWAERAGLPAIEVLASELEALRIDVKLGRAAEALPEIEGRLGRLRSWWETSRRGERVPDARDAEYLGRVLISALDIASLAHQALRDWEATLGSIDEVSAVRRARGASEYELAIDRFNRYGPLLGLGRLAEAQKELEHCLEVFDRPDDAANRSKVLSALADLYDEKSDLPQALGLEHRALAIRNTLPDPADRGISHNNLAKYLDRAGHLSEAAAHKLAALIYLLAVGHGQLLQTWARNHVKLLRSARQAGREHTLPRVADLVSRPDFAALRDWLTASQVELAQLQQEVDAFVAACRTAAVEAESSLSMTEDQGGPLPRWKR